MSKAWIDALVDVGFTSLEAEVYGVLANNETATGYRVGQVLGKPVANVYKAIESLHAKGAVLVDESDTRRIRALPPRELMRLVSRDLDSRRKRVGDALAKLPTQVSDRRIYELGNRAQVFERARSMLQGARRIALLDLGPGPLAELADDLVQTAARGVHVAARTERAIDLAGVELVEIPPRGTAREEPWPGEWLTLVVDGMEHLLAVFSATKELHQGVWSNSPFLAWVFHSGLASEIAIDLVERLVAANAPRARVRAALDRLRELAPADAPGRRKLLADLRSIPPKEG